MSDRGRGDAGPGTRRRHERALERAAAAAGMDRIADGSRFAELHPVALPTEGRFSTVYRTRAVTADGEELGLALQLIDPPGRDPAGFAADLARALRTWEWVADHELVVTLHDWGTEPHCWLLTDATEATLYDRMGRGIDEPLRYGTCVAEALAYAHERGVVHAGLDPSSVVFSGTIAERERPRVTNVGLLSAMRTHADPAAYLDPRYAAPEYFDRQFGDVNAATDVYQLGAVLYSLLTGEPPFDGDYETVRHAILDRRPTVPSARNPAVPERIDDVVMKAMAKQKIARYESVAQLRRELAVSRGR